MLVVSKYPGSDAARLATERFEAITAESPKTDPAPTADTTTPTPELRTWVSANGKFKIKAKMVRADETLVALERDDGRVITLPLDKPSKADLDYVEDRLQE